MAARAEQPVETIKMVENAMGVLDLLRTGKVPLGVNEIAKTCGLNPSTTFRILKTLEASGWVYQTNDDRYITGQKISFVTEKDNLYLALKEVSLYVMKEYTAKYNHAMNLLVRDGANCMILQQSRTNNLMDYTPPLHTTLPFYCCAGGKILLSELPTSLTKQIIEHIVLFLFLQFGQIAQNIKIVLGNGGHVVQDLIGIKFIAFCHSITLLSWYSHDYSTTRK
jgi:DNA-binding IclR family transcriptional regulator